jgi:hypothetical protein
MARIRTIKPEFPQSESMGRVSREARLLYVNLWTVADDEGRARGSSRMLASLLYPYDNDAPALMETWLAELDGEGCVRRYEVDGSTYLDLPNWLKHQRIDKPSKSRLPAFEDGSRVVAKPREESTTDLGPRTNTLDLGNGPRTKTEDIAVASQPGLSERPRNLNGKPRIPTKEIDAEFDAWFAQYPKADGPDAARTRYRSIRRSSRATAAELLQGAMRYSQEKSGTDPTYIKTAKNWLNDGDWKNPPRAPHTGAGNHDQQLAQVAGFLPRRLA